MLRLPFITITKKRLTYLFALYLVRQPACRPIRVRLVGTIEIGSTVRGKVRKAPVIRSGLNKQPEGTGRPKAASGRITLTSALPQLLTRTVLRLSPF